MLIILFIFIIYYLKRKRVVKQNKSIVKNKVKLKNLTIIKASFFCNKNLEYLIIKNINNSFITFNNKKVANGIITKLKNAGFNLNLPIYKLEFYINNKVLSSNKTKVYNKNLAQKTLTKSNRTETIKNNILQQVYKYLQAIKNLQTKNILVNFLFFVDDNSLYKSVNKLVNYFNVNVKIYVKDEVDYNLLGAINSVNTNISNSQNNLKNLNEINNFYYTKNNGILQESEITNNYEQNKSLLFNNFFLQTKSENFYFKNFSYSNFYMKSFVQNNIVNSCLFLTQNTNLNALIFKLKIINKTGRNLPINFNFSLNDIHKSPKNALYLLDSSKSHIYLSNLIVPNLNTFLVGNFSGIKLEKQNIFAKKNFNILPFKSIEFYFLLTLSPQNILTNSSNFGQENLIKNCVNNLLLNLSNYYKNHNYNTLKLTKILTENKTLNLLVNNYLPQKIIKNYVVNSFYTTFNKTQNNLELITDFYNLKNNIFNLKLVDSSFYIQNLNSLFLVKNNLYKNYLNLIYFKLGFFASNSGINLNTNKSQIVSKALVSLKSFNNIITVNVSKQNLNNEIKIGNIKYTNLHFLTITPKTKNLHLQF